MHEYCERKSRSREGLLRHIRPELEQDTGKPYPAILEEGWSCYVPDFLERLPHIGGDDVSGAYNLTGSCCYVAMGEIVKKIRAGDEPIGHLMVLSYERKYKAMPGFARRIMGRWLPISSW